ncbi:MAG: hypothetical protein KHZ29_01290 [Desulfovibrionaceae bacterium]|nr:hypothetical protein [Desulfovibrionaceae bacterium]
MTADWSISGLKWPGVEQREASHFYINKDFVVDASQNRDGQLSEGENT